MKTTPDLAVAPWGATLGELLRAAQDAERRGAAAVWVSELHRSASVTAAAVAQVTTTVQVGTAIMWSFVRSPFTIALEAMDIDELADGRLLLGLGTGVRRLNEDWHHVEWGRPVAHISEVVRAIRKIVAESHTGADLRLTGDYAPLDVTGYERPFSPLRTEIPVYIASVGPRMTQLAGQTADGWISHELTSADYLTTEILPRVDEGIERAGRRREDVDIVASACCAIDDDPEQAKRWAAATVAFYASVRTYEPLFERHGFLGEAKAVQEAFRNGDNKGMTAAVTDRMVDALACAGTRDEVEVRLESFNGVADSVKLSPPTHGVEETVTRNCQQRLLELVTSNGPKERPSFSPGGPG